MTKYLEVKRLHKVNGDNAAFWDPTVWVAEEEPKLDPQEVLRKSSELLTGMKEKPVVKLTVGDLSVVSKKEKERKQAWSEKRVNREDGLTVGDLSVVPKTGSLQELFVGKVTRSSTSPSQERLMAMQRKQRKKAEDVFEFKQCVFKNALEDETRKKDARRVLDDRVEAASAKLVAEHHSWV